MIEDPQDPMAPVTPTHLAIAICVGVALLCIVAWVIRAIGGSTP